VNKLYLVYNHVKLHFFYKFPLMVSLVLSSLKHTTLLW